MPIQDFTDLRVWQEGVALVKAIHAVCRHLPPSERYVLDPQLRRAALSVPANIAEGYGRRSKAEYIRFLSIASGSLTEVRSHLPVAKQLGLAPPKELDKSLELANQLGRMLMSLRRSLRKSR